MYMKGGKIIESGGFGCIFEPPLKCMNDSTLELDNGDTLTKLMTKNKAEDEFNEIQKIKSIVEVIPNYNNYFLLDNFTLCKPDKLTKSDLSNFTKRCKPLKKKNITRSNINDNLDKLLAINMPNGGISVEHFVDNYFSHKMNVMLLNNSLIRLLVNGIAPMNKLGVYHCDIKDTNVLADVLETDIMTRLIDWGLSIHEIDIDKGIPRKLYRRPFQYNTPFSSVIFNKDFLELYNAFLKIHPNPYSFQLREFTINYIFVWNEIRGPGHLSAINDIVKKLTIDELVGIKRNKVRKHVIEYDFTYDYIVDFIVRILEKYTKNGYFDIMKYFQNVFIKNIDIWGFLMMYIRFYEYFYNKPSTNVYQKQFCNKIKEIILKYLYTNPLKPINIESLANELTKLNNFIDNFDSVGGRKTIVKKRRFTKKRHN
jgi:hypothetical protein